MKKWLIMLLTVFLGVLGLAGCSDSDTTSGNSKDGKVEITYGFWDKKQVPAVEEIIKQRTVLADELLNLSITEKIYPSDANFLLVRVKDAPATYQYLMNKRIIVRDRSKVTLCENCLRITVGTPEENKNLIAVLKNL